MAGRPDRPPRGRRTRATGLLPVVALGAAMTLLEVPVSGKDAPVRAPEPDAGFYVQRIAPWLEATCVPCHRGGGAGSFVLSPVVAGEPDAARRARDLRGVRRLIDPEAPWDSRLLRKVLPEDRGGLPHAGGARLTPDDPIHDDLLDFASGATLRNLPPEPEPGRDRRARAGEPVELDGSLSFDRDEDPVRHRWELFARPPGSRASIADPDAAKTTLTPDVAGTYVVRLRVFDGKAWSPARPVVLECLDLAGPVAPDPLAPSGLAGLDPAVLARVRALYGDVLGRPPTPPEARAAAGQPSSALATSLLASLEAGRAWVEDAAFRLGLVGDALPTSEAVAALPIRITSGEGSPADAEAALVRDPAFLRAHPEGPALAAAVERLLLGRTGTPAERAAWSTAAGAFATLGGAEFRVAALRRHLDRFLGPAEVASFPVARADDSVLALARELVGSPAWAGGGSARRRAGDLAFLRGLFADLLGRRASGVELAALSRAAGVLPGSAAGRAAVVDVLLDSGEVLLPLVVEIGDPDAWIADRFLRTLGRTPSPEEVVAYRTVLLDPAGGPHVVVRALCSSEEYASR